MKIRRNIGLALLILSLALGCFLPLAARVPEPGITFTEKAEQVSDHFDGIRYFNPNATQTPPSPPGQAARWLWKLIFRTHRHQWPKQTDFLPGIPPVERAPEGSLFITPIGHGTFLIQMDGVNILTDPIWSERCSPLSWVGPKRKHEPGIRFEDLPPVDAVLVSHNHYDHLDLPTLRRLAKNGASYAVVPLGNIDDMQASGIPTVDELDWWQSVSLTSSVTITLVPAQHYSARTIWDLNKSLWGGFIISGPSGNVFYSGDTGYGPHFQEIARRFSPIRVALLPISPSQSSQDGDPTQGYRRIIHMGPADAVQAHLDLGTPLSIAAHFQVFQLGFDGFHDAVEALAESLIERNLKPDAFIAPIFGQTINIPSLMDESLLLAGEESSISWKQFYSYLPQYGFAEEAIPLSGALPEQVRLSSRPTAQ